MSSPATQRGMSRTAWRAPRVANRAPKDSVVSSVVTFAGSTEMTAPVSIPASITMRETPDSVSPASMAAVIGLAPRYRGRTEGCTLIAPRRGISRVCCRKISPKAATTKRSACASTSGPRDSGSRSVVGL
jgi:hypothetical protein